MAVALLALFAGCSSSVRVTDPPRSATEQFLMSTAASRAVEQLTIEPLRGRSVFVDSQYFAAVDQPFVLGELRAKMMRGGVQLVPEREKAQVIVEVRTGGVGVDRADFLLGIPSVLLRAGGEGAEGETTGVPLATPELALIKNINQRGIASIAFVAYWKDTGEIVATSGPYIGWTLRDDWWFFGLGKRTVGDIPPAQAPD